MWFLVAGVLAVGLVIGAIVYRPWVPAPTPTPTPLATPSATPLEGQPFTMPDDATSTGRWGITSREWQGNSVTLDVWIEADEGQVSYAFAAFSNAGTEVYEPTPGAPTPELTWGTLEPGARAEGYLHIVMPPGAATLVLMTANGTQMSALPIEA